MAVLMSEQGVLYEDERTVVRIKEHQLIKIRKKRLWSGYSKRYCHFDRGETFKQVGSDGFIGLVELTDKKSGYKETTSLVYLLSENISTFELMVRNGMANVNHIVASCEGLGFGGCGRSIFDYIFNQRNFERLRGLNLETVVVPEGRSSHGALDKGVERGMVNLKGIGYYLDRSRHVFGVTTCR
jgi:hypothetical protein